MFPTNLGVLKINAKSLFYSFVNQTVVCFFFHVLFLNNDINFNLLLVSFKLCAYNFCRLSQFYRYNFDEKYIIKIYFVHKYKCLFV